MIEGLERFVADLRETGLAVSPGDFIVAVRAVEVVGIEDRRRLETALRCALCKRVGDRPRFDLVFARHFAARGLRARASRSEGEGPGRGSRRRDRESPTEQRPPVSRSPAENGRGSHARPENAQRRLFEDLQARRRGPMRLRRVIGRAAGALDEKELPFRVGPQRRAQEAAGAARSPRSRPSALDRERALARCLPRVLCQLRLGAGRRLRRAGRGRLWLRRVFRENLSHDGVPWRLPRRRVEPRRPRVVLLLDLSWSTALATGLFLSIAVEFLGRLRRTRILFFVDRVVDGTVHVERWLRGPTPGAAKTPSSSVRRGPPPLGSGIERRGVSFAEILEGIPDLGLESPSDYGRAFSALARSDRRPTGRTTALLVLGDGRSNYLDRQEWAFQEIAERCGAVLWLVPEPAERWGSGDSALDSYLPHVDVVVEASDLEGLARGVAELARRL